MNKAVRGLFVVFFVSSVLLSVNPCKSDPQETVKSDTRCPVCGMFVAKFPSWITQIRHTDGTVSYFDGMKDMMAYYYNPEKFSKQHKDFIIEIWVKDYYSLAWLEAHKAFYVSGSDIYGPMGHELIPFASKEAAQSFKNDHAGKKVFSFKEIPPEVIERLRSGRTMK